MAELIVARDGSGDHPTIQAAIDAVAGTGPVDIRIGGGRYREVVSVPRGKPPIRLIGATGDARDVVITFDNASRTMCPDGTPYDTSGSATLTADADDLVVRDLTIENAYVRDPDPGVRDQQAVALKTEADRIELRNVRLLGHQDTVYANAPRGRIGRQYFRDCFIAGDVDFIFGSATAVFERCAIRALDRGGHACVTAASTADVVRFGFLVIRETWLDASIAAEPWANMSGFSWRAARFFEYRNTGPGAAVATSRPQLSASEAASFTARAYLGDWDPTASR